MNEFENNDLKNKDENYDVTKSNFDNSDSAGSANKVSSEDYGYRVYNSQDGMIKDVSDVESGLSEKANYENDNFENTQDVIYENKETVKPFANFDESDGKSSIQFVTTKKKKNRKFLKRTVAACATIAVFGGSIGFGVMMGNRTAELAESEQGSDYVDFKFNELPEAKQLSISDNNEVIKIVKSASSSVVNISIKAQQTDFFNQVYENTGSGSGIIYKEDSDKYYIVTNNHVVDGATSISISITGTEQIPAKLVGKDAQSEVAVISVKKSDIQNANITDIKVAEFADSSQVEVGEYVLAIGNALGQGKTVTQGIISAQNKQVNIDGKKLTVLQTDAAINPGNSGGALVNSTGKIIGMNTAKLTSSSSGTTVEGTGYALPSSSVKQIADELIENGTISKPYLGIAGFTMTDDFISMYNLNTKGVFITGVRDGGSAAVAGLKYSDIITGMNGTAITSMEELSAALSKCKVGDEVTINIVRNGREAMTVTAKLTDMNSGF